MFSKVVRCIFRWLGISAAVLIIFYAVLINVARAVAPELNHKKPYFEHWASHILGRPVQIHQLSVGWRGLNPAINFSDVVVRSSLTSHQPLQEINNLSVSIDVFHSLLNWKLIPGHLQISGTRLALHEMPDGEVQVNGIVNHMGLGSSNIGTLRDVMLWFVTKPDVNLQHIQIDLHERNGRLLRARDVSFQIKNGMLAHQIVGQGVLVQRKPAKFRFVVALSDIDLKKKKFDADVYFHFDQLLLRPWFQSSYLKKYFSDLHVKKGLMTLSMWSHWTGSQLKHVQTEVDAKDIELRAPTTKQNVFISRLGANLYWQKEQDGWQLSADHLVLKVGEKEWPAHQLSFRYYKTKNKLLKFSGKTDEVNFHDFRAFAKATGLWKGKLKKWGESIKPQGVLRDVVFNYEALPNHHFNYFLQTYFNGLGFNHFKQVPALKNLTGFVLATPKHVGLTLDSRNAVVDMPKQFAKPLSFQTLQGNVVWDQQVPGQFYLSATDLLMNSAKFNFAGDFSLNKKSASASPVIDLKGQFSDSDASYLRRFVPKDHISTYLNQWLSSAFVNGKINDGSVVWQGALDQFPYKNGNGRFKLAMNLDNFTLRYSKHWPTIENISGPLMIDGNGLFINVKKAKTMNNPLSHIRVLIPNMKHPVMTLDGNADSTLAKGLLFFKRTPLKMAKVMKNWKLSGPMKFHMYLKQLLYKKDKPSFFNGSIAVDHATLQYSKLAPKVTSLQGVLNFSDSGMSAEKMTGVMLGEPLSANISTDVSQHGAQLVLRLGGKLNFNTLHQYYHWDFMRYVKGVSNVRGLLTVAEKGAGVVSKLSLMSNLENTAVDFPSPYHKLAGDPGFVKLNLAFATDNNLNLLLNYNNSLSFAGTYSLQKNTNKLMSGELRLGKAQAQLQTTPGLLIDGYLPQWDWNVWKPYFANLYPSNRQRAGEGETGSCLDILREVDLEVGKVNWMDVPFGHAYFTLKSLKNRWQVFIDNAYVKGKILIPTSQNHRWDASFDRLWIPNKGGFSSKNKKHIIKKISPLTLPSFHFECSDCRYRKHNLGKIYIDAQKRKTGLLFNKFDIWNALFSLKATGKWNCIGAKCLSSFSGDFSNSDIGKFLTTWQLTKAVNEGKGDAHFDLHWQGSPYEFAVKTLSGKLSLNYRYGRIVNLSRSTESKLGFGRVLNLLSVQSLPQNVFTGFSHLSKKGFRFNVLKGDFTIAGGRARTENAAVVGPVAWVQMQGLLDLVKEKYDFKMQVVPNVSSSLPLIVGLAGGPVAGAIAWVVNKIIEMPLGKVAQTNYLVTGSWKDPKITKYKPKESSHL